MQYDIHLILRAGGSTRYLVELRAPDGRTAVQGLDISPIEPLQYSSIPWPADAVQKFASLLWQGEVLDLLAETIAAHRAGDFGRILFDSGKVRALEDLPWESAMSSPPLLGEELVFVRWNPAPAKLSGVPLQIPIRCLSIALAEGSPFDLAGALVTEPAERGALRTTAVSGHFADLEALLAGERFDIVHLATGIRGVPAGLGRWVERGATRLLSLQLPDSLGYRWVLNELHEMIRSGGPAVVLTHFGGDAAREQEFYAVLYRALVMDLPIDAAFSRAQRSVLSGTEILADRGCELFFSNGAENLLSLSAFAERLEEKVEDEFLNVQASAAEGPGSTDDGRELTVVLRQAEDYLHSAHGELRVFGKREGTGLGLLASASEYLEHGRLLAGTRASRSFEEEFPTDAPGEESGPRVVNVSVLGRDGILSPERTLQPRTRYNVRVQVGRRLAESIVRNPASVPETMLRQFMRTSGLPLRVVVSSRDFDLLDSELELLLPPSGPSEMLHFRVRTGYGLGTAQLRIALYYQSNLLQSVRLTAEIANGEKPGEQGVGNSAEVEYCICGTMRQIEMYAPRAVSFLINGSGDTHTFEVVGTEIKEGFQFGDLTMRGALQAARKTLLGICARLDHNGKPKPGGYRYDSNTNRGTPAQFIEDLRKLAERGLALYSQFVINNRPGLQQKLDKTLAAKSEIQIASTKSANYVFPWALVYSRRLRPDPKNVICPQFLADLQNAGVQGLLSQMCLDGACPHENDKNVICPSGFWGYKHVLEQPPSIAGETETPGRDLPMHLEMDGVAQVMMGVSLKLKFSEEHHKQLSQISGYRVAIKRDKDSIVDSMTGAPAPNLVYFYCHGGKKEGEPFLGIGKDENLTVQDLVGSGLAWPVTHPLVFINGCGTAELLPDDLLTFVGAFVNFQAAGVIGTEISIPESLAREFGLQFFDLMLVPGMSVGEAVRHLRLRLLAKYNLLGLVYTPYCHAALQFDPSPVSRS